MNNNKIIMDKPNFFIAGAPKSGTSAIVNYLSQHPNVFISNPKEPLFFATDYNFRPITKFGDYINLFSSSKPMHYRIGEGSSWYFYSSDAFTNILNSAPDSKIIIILRNPVDLILSLHQHWLHALVEDQKDFTTAWNLQDERQSGLFIPKHCRDKRFLHYRELGSLDKYLPNLLENFPSNQVLVLIYEEFFNDIQNQFQKVLKFLDLNDTVDINFKIVNDAQVFRNDHLRKVLCKTPMSIRNLYTKIRVVSGFKWLPNMLDIILKNKGTKFTLSNEQRLYFSDVFDNHVVKVEELLGRKIPSWHL